MKILFNDILQFSNAPDALKTPALSETTVFNNPLTVQLNNEYKINAIGTGNTDGTYFDLSINDAIYHFNFAGNGLYVLPITILASKISVISDATFIGRLAAGIGVNIPTSIAKEPGFNSTAEPRKTLSGQVIPGSGGYNYKTLSLDSRYKIGKIAMEEIKSGYKYIGMGYPFFIDLADEAYKLPFSKLYAIEKNQRQMVFESGIAKYLFSRRFEFEECF